MFAEIALKDQRQAAVQRFEKRMAATPEVVACYVISGRYDYLVRIACPDLAHYHRLISGWLDEAALGVEKIVTNIELQTIKEFAGFPLPKPAARQSPEDGICACAGIKRVLQHFRFGSATPAFMPLPLRAPAGFTPMAARSSLDFPHQPRI